jgi:hypothetical protein
MTLGKDRFIVDDPGAQVRDSENLLVGYRGNPFGNDPSGRIGDPVVPQGGEHGLVQNIQHGLGGFPGILGSRPAAQFLPYSGQPLRGNPLEMTANVQHIRDGDKGRFPGEFPLSFAEGAQTVCPFMVVGYKTFYIGVKKQGFGVMLSRLAVKSHGGIVAFLFGEDVFRKGAVVQDGAGGEGREGKAKAVHPKGPAHSDGEDGNPLAVVGTCLQKLPLHNVQDNRDRPDQLIHSNNHILIL